MPAVFRLVDLLDIRLQLELKFDQSITQAAENGSWPFSHHGAILHNVRSLIGNTIALPGAIMALPWTFIDARHGTATCHHGALVTVP